MNKLDVIVLVETHLDGDRAERLGNQIQYDGHARVDAEGHSRGIWLYWKKAVVNLDILFYHNQHITVRISRNDQEPWIFTAIYASPDITKRQDLWYNLSNFSGTLNEPWLLAGDANNATYCASVEDIAVQYCFFDILLTSLSPRNCIPPEVLLRSLNAFGLCVNVLKCLENLLETSGNCGIFHHTRLLGLASSRIKLSSKGRLFMDVQDQRTLPLLSKIILAPFSGLFRNSVLTSIWYIGKDLCAA
ncbi:hypothetical protein Tco_1263161 [Tanacetum coccineum]